jgi:hypothetical protein
MTTDIKLFSSFSPLLSLAELEKRGRGGKSGGCVSPLRPCLCAGKVASKEARRRGEKEELDGRQRRR